jgi:hypothetical protein
MSLNASAVKLFGSDFIINKLFKYIFSPYKFSVLVDFEELKYEINDQ